MKIQKLIFLVFLLPAISISHFSCSQTDYKATLNESNDSLALINDLTDSLKLKLSDSTLSSVKDNSIKKETLQIIGVGDMMFGTNFPSTAHLPPNEGKDLISEVDSILKSADLTFGNLEGVVLNKGGQVKRCSDPSKCYAFRMPEKLVEDVLKQGGFDVVSIANNHMGDFGNSGRENSKKFLESINIEYAGLVSCPYTMFEKEGVKYGFAAFAPNSGTMDIRNIKAAEAIVKTLNDSCDVVIVSFHGGAEGRSKQHITRKTETFYGENRGNVYAFSHAMIDAGADIIFGHGPHVTRAMEVYKDRFVAYSLGNFCTYDRFSLRGESGLAPIVNLKVDKEGKFISGQITPIIQRGRGGVSIDKDKKVIPIIQNLNKTDIPEGIIEITDEGGILIKEN
ncbi:CapA family protein [Bernardetia sp. ABR2-2B]|uniref:CapA family protein n=1 Tax=Bernardetia sp. ABR2-2B TaxID=3127472 RepID=UPI0030D52074